MITRREVLLGGGALGVASLAAAAIGLAIGRRDALPRARPEAPAPLVPEDPAHGRLLVERAIDAFTRADENLLSSDCDPTPLSAGALAELSLPGGAPLPASLRAWLGFDATYGRWFRDLCKPSFPELGLVDALVHVGVRRSEAYGFAGLEREALRGKCLPFPIGDVSRRVLYLGATDARGEYPVIVLDWDDEPWVELDAPGLDVFLADLAGIVHRPEGGWQDHPTYGARASSAMTATFGAALAPTFGAPGFPVPPVEDMPRDAIESEIADRMPLVLPDGAPVPPGAQVRVVMNPFTKRPERWVIPPPKDPNCPVACD